MKTSVAPPARNGAPFTSVSPLAALSVSALVANFSLLVLFLTWLPAPAAFAGGCEDPTIETPAATTFEQSTFSEFSVRTAGDNGIIALSCIGSLPSGVAFENEGDGRGRLYGTPAPGSAGIYNLVMHAENCAGESHNQNFTLTVITDCVVPPSGLISWWPGDGNARDIWGPYTGTLLGNTTFAAGKAGQAFSFDGTGDWIDVGDVDLPVTFTIGAWVRPTDFANQPRIFSKDNGGTRSYDFWIGTAGNLVAAVFSGNGATFYETGSGAVTAGTFQHVAVTYDGNAGAGARLKFYVNGVSVNAGPSGFDAGGAPFNTAISARIGGFAGYAPNAPSFKGSIDELALFSRVLPQAEIQAIHDVGGAGKCKPVIYVSTAGNETVQQLDPSGNASLFTNAGLNNPYGLALSDEGELYVASAGNNTIRKFDANGNGTVFADAADGINNPRGIAFDRDGNLYVANNGNNTIQKLDPAGNGTLFASSNLNAPYGLAFDLAGNLYVANFNGSTITKFDAGGNGTVFADAADGLSGPLDLAFDRNGHLFVSNWSNDTITKLTPTGNATLFANTGLDGPWGLAFDQAGNLYVVNELTVPNSVARFDTAGNRTVFAMSGLSDPGFLAVRPSALPDPGPVTTRMEIEPDPGGGYRISFISNPGRQYTVQFCDDLLADNWQFHSTHTADGNGMFFITDNPLPGTAQRFYRALLPYLNNFNTSLGPATLRGTAVRIGQAIRLTDNVMGQLGAVVIDASAVSGMTGFTAKFDLALGPSPDIPADGASFAVGDLGTNAWGEAGPGTTHSLAVSFDTFNNGGPPGPGNIGIHVFVNGVAVATNPTNPYTNGVFVPVEVSFDTTNGLTVKYNNVTIFNNQAISGFSVQSGDRFGVGARTGGAVEKAVVDNIELTPR